jgi:hypothetical protein
MGQGRTGSTPARRAMAQMLAQQRDERLLDDAGPGARLHEFAYVDPDGTPHRVSAGNVVAPRGSPAAWTPPPANRRPRAAASAGQSAP